ncbi:MAG: hypothetical protein ACI4JC_03670 [Faecalibacterium sp.]
MPQTIEELILGHCSRYPKLEVQDLLKLLHQSAFGCGHFVWDEEECLRRIFAELPASPDVPAVEEIGGGYCRLHLSALRDGGLQPQTLMRMFVCSAAQPAPGLPLEESLPILLRLAQEGRLPFAPQQVREKAGRWQAAGFPACHHSRAFRQAYRPAYRVVRRELGAFLPILRRIDALLREKPQVVFAIEGGSASGKTTLAGWLQQLYSCNVFHMDDFFLRPEQRTPERYAEPGGNVDRERFREEILLPLRAGQTVDYRRFDCGSFTLLPPQRIPARRLNIIEGCYSLHPELCSFYDGAVFVRIDPQLQRARLQKRNTPAQCKRFLEEWIPLETRYFEAMQPWTRCTLEWEALE